MSWKSILLQGNETRYSLSRSFLYIFKSKPSTDVQPIQEQKAENRSEANWANSAGSVSVPSAPLANRTPDSRPPGSSSQLHFLRAHFPNSSPIFLLFPYLYIVSFHLSLLFPYFSLVPRHWPPWAGPFVRYAAQTGPHTYGSAQGKWTSD